MTMAIGIGIGLPFGGGSGFDLADLGDTLIDFSRQSLTVGTGTSYAAFGGYSAARGTQTHESELTGVTESLTASGWETTTATSTTPGDARAMRYRIDFTPRIDLSSATNFVLEIEYPQEMLTGDFGQGHYLGVRIQFHSGAAATNSTWQVVTLFGTQSIFKQRTTTLVIPAANKATGSGFWSIAGGTGCDWTDVSRITFYMYQRSTNGGTRHTLRKLRVNRAGRKGIVTFTMDDGSSSQYTYRSIYTSAGIRPGVAVIQTTMAGGGAFTLAQAQEMHDDHGWAFYNHMLTDTDRLAATFNAIATPWSGGQFTGTTSAAAYADATVGEFYEIRKSWGPEISGSHELLSKGASNQLTFDCPTAPYLSVFPSMRFDWPGETKAERITNQVVPCTSYLNTNGITKGTNFFVAPGGDYDVDFAAALADAGFVGCRITEPYYTPQETGSPWNEYGPMHVTPEFFDPWQVATVWLDNVTDNTTNQDIMTGYIDKAIEMGGIINFSMHSIAATHGSSQTDADLLTHIVNYAATKVAAGELEALTLDEVAVRYGAVPSTVE